MAKPKPRKVAPRAFPTGALVPSEDLVGREPILASLMERVYEQRNSVVLSAPRQTGKSSVVAELLRRVTAKGGWGITIDCSLATDVDDLARLVAAATYDQAAESVGAFATLGNLVRNIPRPVLFQTDTNLALTFHSDRPDITTTLRVTSALQLADTLASERDRRTIVVYDEFPSLRKLSSKIFDQVRAALQRATAQTSYIFMGSEVGVLEELFKNRRHAPFRLATVIPLPPPSKEEWVTYLRRRFRELGRPLVNGQAGELYDFSGGHPRDLMELCQNLLTLRKLKVTAESGDVAIAEQQTYDALRRHFEDLWSSLDEPAGVRTIARRIAVGQSVYGGKALPVRQVKRAIDELEHEGIIRKVGRGGYEFSEPLFGKFVAQSRPRS